MKTNSSLLSAVLLAVGVGCVVALSRGSAKRSPGRREQKFISPPRPVPQSGAESGAERRALDYLDACSRARRRNARAEALRYLEAAKEEVRRYLKIDHPVNAQVLNMWGCLKHDDGFVTDALHLWEGAASVASEWPTACRSLIPVIRDNLRLVS